MIELTDASAFYRQVWMVVQQIPPGRVATYGQIAAMLPAPDGVASEDYRRLGPRWVGDAMNAVSAHDAPDIPWHRVINSRGGISLPPASRAAAIQRGRLRHEGIDFDAAERVDLGRYGWDGPEPAWLAAHGYSAPPSLRTAQAEDDSDAPQQLSLF
jgi:methylated-DNA-protein-cysteine methyltransferase-like protein